MVTSATRRLGAYILPGDPVWLASSLSRYYDLLDDLVVLVPEGGRGWTGRTLPVEACLGIIRRVDHRGLARVVTGSWTDSDQPMRAETSQRQAGTDALSSTVDWILQIDNDEVLPQPEALIKHLEMAEERDIRAVEWPMRVMFRRRRAGEFLEVVAEDGAPRYEYPGPVAVRAGATHQDARRVAGGVLRVVVSGDRRSLQLRHAPAPGEFRSPSVGHAAAILHNSWGRSSASVHAKVRSWGHNLGWRTEAYYWAVWRPAPLTWRVLRNFHPFEPRLWPRLRPAPNVGRLLVLEDR